MSKPRLIIGNKNYSSWSLRGWLVLRKAGADFDEERLPLDTPEFSERIQGLSPTHRVPALWDEGQCIWDSLAIAEYANERWAEGRLLPDDRALRGLARSIMAEMHAGFAALREQMPMNIRGRDRRVDQVAALAADIDRITAIWTDCLARSGGPWLLGAFSLVDAMYAPVVMRFRTYGVAVPAPIEAYMAHVEADVDVAEWIRAALEETEIVAADEAGI